MYFTFLYNTFQNHDLMRAWKANRWPWDKAGTFVYTRFGLTFTSVSVPAPIFRKYPLNCWWICTVSDPSPKLHSVPVWMDELNPGAQIFPTGDQDPAQLHLHRVSLGLCVRGCARSGSSKSRAAFDVPCGWVYWATGCVLLDQMAEARRKCFYIGSQFKIL